MSNNESNLPIPAGQTFLAPHVMIHIAVNMRKWLNKSIPGEAWNPIKQEYKRHDIRLIDRTSGDFAVERKSRNSSIIQDDVVDFLYSDNILAAHRVKKFTINRLDDNRDCARSYLVRCFKNYMIDRYRHEHGRPGQAPEAKRAQLQFEREMILVDIYELEKIKEEDDMAIADYDESMIDSYEPFLETLTGQPAAIWKLKIEGSSNRDVAKKLNMSHGTVDARVKTLFADFRTYCLIF